MSVVNVQPHCPLHLWKWTLNTSSRNSLLHLSHSTLISRLHFPMNNKYRIKQLLFPASRNRLGRNSTWQKFDMAETRQQGFRQVLPWVNLDKRDSVKFYPRVNLDKRDSVKFCLLGKTWQLCSVHILPSRQEWMGWEADGTGQGMGPDGGLSARLDLMLNGYVVM